MDQYKDIRHYYIEEGMSERAIAKLLGVSRNTVSKYKNGAVLPGYRQRSQRKAPVTDSIRETVVGYLKEEQDSPLKQRQTAQRVLTRLKAEHKFTGSYSTVRDLVRELKGNGQAFIPLQFDPGQAAQVDWGTAYAFIAGVKTKVQLFCMRLCNSGAIFVMAFPTQRYESLLMGHVEAFKFFGGVPKTLIYDNMRTVVKEGWGKYVREEQQPFKLLKAHYIFKSKFCNPRAGNEKGLVENLVSLSRRNVMSPMPRVESYAKLNELLEEYCLAYLGHKIRNRPAPVGRMLETELIHMQALPEIDFDPAITASPKANSYALVRHDKASYSVPAVLAGKILTLKAYPLRVEIWHKGEIVAKHTRSYVQHYISYRLEHYLPLLEKKPRAVQDAAPVKQTINQGIRVFGELLPDRDFVALLKLTLDYGQEAVMAAIEKVVEPNYDLIRLELLQKKHKEKKVKTLKVNRALPTVRAVDLNEYDLLYKQVASHD